MTTRGTNPSSISPPVPIQQPRHVSNIPSGTPPPGQQLFPGQSPGLVQGQAFNHIAPYQQTEQLLSYQAYGSAPNDLRGPNTSSGRGGPANMAQSGAYYHQLGQNMRSPQPPPPNPYYISQTGQGGMRHPRPTHGSSNQPIMFLQQHNNNMVISPNMYPQARMMYPQGAPQFQSRYSQPSGVMYFNGVPRPNVPMQTQGMGPPPQPREKRFISISDPTTGRNITEEIINSSHQQSTEEKSESDETVGNKGVFEIRKNFTRQVVERMKTGESVATAIQPTSESSHSATLQQSQSSQEHPPLTSYPSGPSQQVQSTSSIVSGAPLPGSMVHPAINLSVPPPQLPHNIVFNRQGPPSQQQPNPGKVPPQSQHTQSAKVLTPAVKAELPVSSSQDSVANDTSQIVDVSNPQTQQDVLPQSDTPVSVKSSSVAIPSPTTDEQSAGDSISKDLHTYSEESSSDQPDMKSNASDLSSDSAAQISEQSMPMVCEKDSVPKTDSPPAVEPIRDQKPELDTNTPNDVAAANSQDNRDGKKSKKNKKDFSRKESGGSEMDAFIDNSNTTMNNGNAKVEEHPNRDLDDSISLKQISDVDSTVSVLQVESKSKLKKKKKKKGKKSAASSKAKAEELETGQEKPELSQEMKVYTVSIETSPNGSHLSEGKDSGVDSESGNPLTTESKVIEKDLTLTMPVEAVQEKTVITAIEAKAEESHEKHAESDFDKAQESDFKKLNGDTNPSDKLNNVPHDSQVEAEEDVITSNETSEIVNENGPSQDEAEMEISKAEQFTQLKKSGGKLVYDRAYLMELRECVSSQTKPDGLPALEIILDQPTPFLSRPSGGPADFTPSFFQSGGNQRHAPPIGKSSSRGRQRPGDMPGTPRVIKSISISTDVKPLHQSENPWKPAKKEDKSEPKTLEGEILFIMNRLTPTNFEKLATEMKRLNVKTYSDLQQMVNIFFDKVTLETKFVEAYAQLCKVMSQLKVPPPSDGTVKENMATFRVVMLTKCQHEFEADKSVVFEAPEEKKKKMEAENPEKTPERDELIQKTLYHMKLRRMKFYGNIRFIGELFKLGMLTENIMHDCIFRLLKARDDDSLVSLCNLLTTVGRLLDSDKARPRMDQYFLQMSKIADERKSRIKFTLRDVIDLRLNHWVPRKEAAGPKKIDEVHKDYAQEQARNQYLASQPPPPRNDNAQVGSRRGSRQRPDENRMSEDGWNTVPNKNLRMPIDANKMKISKSVVDDNIQLGPGGGSHRPMWSRGSHGGAQPQDDRPTLTPNRFSALNDDVKKPFPRSPSRGEGSAGRSLRQGQTAGHGRGKLMSRSSQEGDRREAIANTRSFMEGRSQNSSRDNSWNREHRRQFMGPRSSYERDNPMTRSDSAAKEFKMPAPPAVKQMSDQEIEKKAVNTLDEYLNIKDLGEAKLCVKELEGQKQIHLFVTASINNVLEKRDEARRMTGNLFHELVCSNILNAEMYIKGLYEVLQYASDMVVDIPTLWNCLAQVISPLLTGGSLNWAMLKQALSPHLDNKDGAKLMAFILSQCVEKQGEKEISQKWQNSGLSWSLYLKPEELESFVKDKKLDFTLGDTSRSINLLPDLEQLIRNRAPNSSILSYIEKSSPSKTDPTFIRAVTTSIVSSSITDKRVNEDLLMNHKDVLKRYIGADPALQLQALYAIQTLMAKLEHPSGVLTKVFELFYYENIVEDDVFYKWERCTDPQEQEAKGSCLMQTRQFFVWLRENEEPEPES